MQNGPTPPFLPVQISRFLATNCLVPLQALPCFQ